MKQRYTTKQMIDAVRNPQSSDLGAGVGLYRQGYSQDGLNFWGLAPASMVLHFVEKVVNPEWLADRTVLDLGAGTGKNTLELLRQGALKGTAVEIDSVGAMHMLQALIALENAGLLPEDTLTVVKASVIDFLLTQTGLFDVVISYGLLHVFKDPAVLELAIELIKGAVADGGYLIVQAITDKYAAPPSQPELEGVIVSVQLLYQSFPESEWELVQMNTTDIVHSHAGSEEDGEHRHGSIRMILKKKAS